LHCSLVERLKEFVVAPWRLEVIAGQCLRVRRNNSRCMLHRIDAAS
jgi:hypothetical protein